MVSWKGWHDFSLCALRLEALTHADSKKVKNGAGRARRTPPYARQGFCFARRPGARRSARAVLSGRSCWWQARPSMGPPTELNGESWNIPQVKHCKKKCPTSLSKLLFLLWACLSQYLYTSIFFIQKMTKCCQIFEMPKIQRTSPRIEENILQELDLS